MAALPFQIEVVVAERSLVIARQLELVPFVVAEGATLAGLPVGAMELPRARGAGGSVRTDLFGFRLLRPDDSRRLKPGDVVELAGWRPAP